MRPWSHLSWTLGRRFSLDLGLPLNSESKQGRQERPRPAKHGTSTTALPKMVSPHDASNTNAQPPPTPPLINSWTTKRVRLHPERKFGPLMKATKEVIKKPRLLTTTIRLRQSHHSETSTLQTSDWPWLIDWSSLRLSTALGKPTIRPTDYEAVTRDDSGRKTPPIPTI